MPEPDGSQRPWRIIAKELALETNPEKIVELSDELDAACAAQWTNPENDDSDNEQY